jgi:hypothetical protein
MNNPVNVLISKRSCSWVQMQKHGDPPAAIVEDIGASIQADLSQSNAQQAAEGHVGAEQAPGLDPDLLRGVCARFVENTC